ncbi:MAG: pyridoxal-phosphate dependent enzyme, partial [Vulcanisaeta sp.]
AVQVQGFAKLYEELHGEYRSEPTRIADALRVSEPPRISQMVNAVKSSNGDAIVVTDDEIVRAWRHILRSGFIIEPSSAIVVSAFWKLIDNKQIGKDDEVVLILTGSGLKYIDIIGKYIVENIPR